MHEMQEDGTPGERTVIKTTAAKKRGIRFQPGDPTILFTAIGQRMRVDGTGQISVEANGISADINALVSEAIQDEMLLSYTELIAVKIIPGGFPNTVVKSCCEITTSSECEKLIKDYPVDFRPSPKAVTIVTGEKS